MLKSRKPDNTDRMFGLSFGHLIILLVVVLLFGHRRLPELGGALGKGLRSFKKGLEGKEETADSGSQINGPDTTRKS